MLHVFGKARADAVAVILARVQAFRLEEDQVRILVREANDLVLDAGAVARPATADLARVHRGAIQVRANHVVDRGIRIRRMAGNLRKGDLLGTEAERPGRVVAGLEFALGEVDGAAIESARGTGLESGQFKPGGREAIAHAFGGGVAGSAADGLGFPRVHDRFEERARRENDGRREVARVASGQDADHPWHRHSCLCFHQQPFDQLLPQRQILLVLDPALHGELVEFLVALGARRVHRRALARVQHAELNSAGIGASTHDAAECVDLADDLPLGDATDGRVATHLGHGVRIHREQTRFRAEPSRRHRRLDTCVSGPDYNHIEREGERHELHSILGKVDSTNSEEQIGRVVKRE